MAVVFTRAAAIELLKRSKGKSKGMREQKSDQTEPMWRLQKGQGEE